MPRNSILHKKNGGYPLVSPFVGHCRLLNVAFYFHSFVFYRRRFLPSFAPQSVFVPLANSYTTIKYPQKNGGYPLVSPFVGHCRLLNVAFYFHSFVFYRRRFLPSFAPQSVFVPLVNSYTTIKYPQKKRRTPVSIAVCFALFDVFKLFCFKLSVF